MQIVLDRTTGSKSQAARPVASANRLAVRFWGTRGGIACPGSQTARYGGNTSCVELRFGDHLLIFDAGTGLRQLGEAVLTRGNAVKADIFFSHFHMDHVCGLPFFVPCYLPTSQIRIWGASGPDGRTTKQALGALMADPLFPVSMEEFKAKIEFHDFRPGDKLNAFSDATIKTMPLNHPGGCAGYRLDFRNKSVAYVTDTEHKPGTLDRNVLELADGADMLIYDANYTDEEFPRYAGWGHSTWQEGVRLADAAGVDTLVLFHHDPKHHDEMLDRISAEAERARPGTVVGREDLEIQI